jgi:preprotein translocase subunit YajC
MAPMGLRTFATCVAIFALLPAAQAQNAAAQAPGIMTLAIPFAVIIVMMFFMTRSGNKRAAEHQRMVSGLQRNEEVVITGGIAGRIEEVGDTYLTLEIAPNVKIKVEKSAVAKLLPKGALKA